MKVYVMEDGTVAYEERMRVFRKKEDLVRAYIERIKEDDWPPTYYQETVNDVTKNEADAMNPEAKLTPEAQTEMLRAFHGLPFAPSKIDMAHFLWVHCPDVSYFETTLE